MKFAIEQLQSLLRRLGLVEERVTTLETIESDASHTHTLSGDVTSVGTVTTIAANVVTVAKMQQIDSQRLLGRNTADTGNVEILSALPTDIDALYARLLGRAGGQHLRGGTAASETLTLESTSHGTKGPVLINPNGGNVAVGTATASSPLTVAGAGTFDNFVLTVTDSGRTPLEIISTDSGASPFYASFYRKSASPAANDALGAFMFQGNDLSGAKRLYSYFGARLDDPTSASIDGSLFFNVTVNNVETEVLTIRAGNMGVGAAFPQGKFHAHDGTAGFLFVSKTAIGNTAQVLIPDGAGDVTTILRVDYMLVSSGGSSAGQLIQLVPTDDVPLITVSGNTLNLRVNANGSVDVRRSAGSTQTFTFSALLRWI